MIADLDDETRRVQHRHRLAEPDPSSKPLTAREESGLAGGARASASRANVNEPAASFSGHDLIYLGVRPLP